MRLLALIFCTLCLSFVGLHAQQTGDTTETFSPDWDWTPEQFMANELVYSLGGHKVWGDKSWNISYDVSLTYEGTEAARYHYEWNRAKNECIVIGKTPDQRTWKVHLTDLTNRKGTAVVDTTPVIESELQGIIDMAYSRFRTDLHALFLPFELLDSGVSMSMHPDTLIDNVTFAVIEVKFPKDSTLTVPTDYWIHVNSQSKAIDGYRYSLDNGNTAYYKIDQYHQYGQLRLATRRKSLDGRHAIKFENIKITKNDVQ